MSGTRGPSPVVTGTSNIKLHRTLRVAHACQHISLRLGIRIEPFLGVHSYVPLQEPRFAGSTLSLPAGRRDADSVFFSRLQQCLTSANRTSCTRAAELDDHAFFRGDRIRCKNFRNGTAETLLHDSLRLHSQGDENTAAGIHK